MGEIAIILLNYNNANDTLECVDSIIDNCGLNYKIIVVDNKSTDNSREVLKLNSDKYHLILSDTNEGFAIGNNIGIQYALEQNIEYIMLLNNDTLIEKGSIEKLYNYIKENKDVGAIAPRTMYYPQKDTIWFDGGKIDWMKFTVEHFNMGKKITDDDVKNQPMIEEVDFLTGCCILLKSEVFKTVGLLPEEYFMYYEDVDFSVKIADAGYKLVVLREAKIYHKVSASSGGEDSPFSIKWGNRNRFIFIQKYKDKGKNIILTYAFFYSSRLIKFSQYLLSGDKSRFNALKEGITSGRQFTKNI